ncbi:hypothetical protein V8C44DRAFT_317525 [Trichoderma aethiopicum]
MVGCIGSSSHIEKQPRNESGETNTIWARQRLSTPPAAVQGFPSIPSPEKGTDRVSFPHKYSELQPKQQKKSPRPLPP